MMAQEAYWSILSIMNIFIFKQLSHYDNRINTSSSLFIYLTRKINILSLIFIDKATYTKKMESQQSILI